MQERIQQVEEKSQPEVGTYQRLPETYPEVFETPPEEMFLPQPSWFKRNILSRLAWLGSLLGSCATLGFVWLKALFQLMTLRPRSAAITFLKGSAASLGIFALSIAGLINPPWIQKGVQLLLFPPRLDIVPDPAHVIEEEVPSDRGKIQQARSVMPCTPKHLIIFLGVACSYQTRAAMLILQDTVDDLHRHGIIPNYPGVTRQDYDTQSKTELINTGIATIYDLAKRHKWKNHEISQNVQLYGLSKGGAIAAGVAEHFKVKFGIDMPVFADRTYRSTAAVAAAHLNRSSHIPLFCAKALAPCVLYGSGDWNLNTVKACNNLNPAMLRYYNLAHEEEKKAPVRKSWVQKICDFFRLKCLTRPLEKLGNVRKYSTDADVMIPDGSTLTEGMEEDSTQRIRATLNTSREAHLIYPVNNINPMDNHGIRFNQLTMKNGRSSKKFFREVIDGCSPGGFVARAQPEVIQGEPKASAGLQRLQRLSS